MLQLRFYMLMCKRMSFFEMPIDFRNKRKVLKLRKTLYGLGKNSHAFWKYLTQKLKNCGLVQSKFDLWPFLEEQVICIDYVDNLIFRSRDEADIHDLALELCEEGVDLEQEYDYDGILVV